MGKFKLAENGQVTLNNLELYKEKHLYYLKATFLNDTPEVVEKITVNNIKLPVVFPAVTIVDRMGRLEPEVLLDFGFGDLELENSWPNGADVKVETIKNKTQKLTLAEIEKKLGYKIELVSEEVG